MSWPLLLAVTLLAAVLPAGSAAAHGGGGEDYRWVGDADPAELGRSTEVVGGVPTDLWTPDAQAVLSLPAGSLAAGPDEATTVSVAAADPADLGALPDGLAVAGNPYRVDVTLAAPGRIVLAAAHPVTAVLHSPDGEVWRRLVHRSAGEGRVETALAASGWYVAATDAGHGRPPVAWGALAVGVVLLVAGGRRRHRTGRTRRG